MFYTDPAFIVLAALAIVMSVVLYRKTKSWQGETWVQLMIKAPLPMLALASSYGVYSFSVIFMPWWMALLSSTAFELVYISLAYVTLTSQGMKTEANRVAAGSVIVAILYNVIASYLHLRPVDWSQVEVGWVFLLSIVHGAPLATVAYFYSKLMFHKNELIEPTHSVIDVQPPERPSLPPPPAGTYNLIVQYKNQGMSPQQVADKLGNVWTVAQIKEILRQKL